MWAKWNIGSGHEHKGNGYKKVKKHWCNKSLKHRLLAVLLCVSHCLVLIAVAGRYNGQ